MTPLSAHRSGQERVRALPPQQGFHWSKSYSSCGETQTSGLFLLQQSERFHPDYSNRATDFRKALQFLTIVFKVAVFTDVCPGSASLEDASVSASFLFSFQTLEIQQIICFCQEAVNKRLTMLFTAIKLEIIPSLKSGINYE